MKSLGRDLAAEHKKRQEDKLEKGNKAYFDVLFKKLDRFGSFEVSLKLREGDSADNRIKQFTEEMKKRGRQVIITKRGWEYVQQLKKNRSKLSKAKDILTRMRADAVLEVREVKKRE